MRSEQVAENGVTEGLIYPIDEENRHFIRLSAGPDHKQRFQVMGNRRCGSRTSRKRSEEQGFDLPVQQGMAAGLDRKQQGGHPEEGSAGAE